MRNTLACLIALVAVGASAEDPKMPSSVRQETVAPQACRYTIIGVFTNGFLGQSASRKKDVKNEDDSFGGDDMDIYLCTIPSCTSFTADLQTATVSFVTSNQLTNVVQVVNDLARMGGDIPYWEELLMRDLQAPRENAIAYSLVNVSSNKPDIAGLKWTPVRSGTTTRLPFRYAKGKSGSLVVNRSTAFCMACNRFSLRVCDASGKWLWQDTDNVYADCSIAVCDENEDGVDEILIDRNDHGFKIHYLLYRKSFQQPPAGDAPKAAPEE